MFRVSNQRKSIQRHFLDGGKKERKGDDKKKKKTREVTEMRKLFCAKAKRNMERGHAKNMSTCPSIVLFRDVYSKRQLSELHDDFSSGMDTLIHSHSICFLFSYFSAMEMKKIKKILKGTKRKNKKELKDEYSKNKQTNFAIAFRNALTFRGWGVEFFAQLLDSAIMT